MVKTRVGVILLVLMLLSACTSKQDENKEQNNPMSLEPIAVQTHIVPEREEPGKPVKIQALVTQGDEKVLDANEVLFEIWKKGQEQHKEQHEKILGSHQGEGIYSIEKTFDVDGLYFVISHVTARGMHTMPTNAFAIGKVSDEELKEMEEVNRASADDDHEHHDHGEHSTNEEHAENDGNQTQQTHK